MPDLQRQKYAHNSDDWIYGITLEGERTKDIDNIDPDRCRPERWEYGISVRQFTDDLTRGTVRNIATTARARRLIRTRTHGIAAIPEVRKALDDEFGRIRERDIPKQRTIAFIPTRESDTIPQSDHTAGHTYRPRGHATR